MTGPASPGDPYVRAGLHRNPFLAGDRPGEPAGTFVDRGLPDPPASGFVEVVGDKGAGKTTHVLRWLAHAGGGPYHHVPPGAGRFAPLPVAPVVAWDEVDRVPTPLLALAVRRARRSGALVLVGTHRPLGLGGPVHVLPPPAPAELERWAGHRITAAAVDVERAAAVLGPVPASAVASGCRGCWWQAGTLLHAWAAERVVARPSAPVGS